MTSAFHCPCLSYSARNRLPKLQRLYIDELSETIDKFEYAPQLRRFNFRQNIHPSQVKIPWSQLQQCVTEYRGANSCREVLRLTPNLEEFVVWPNYSDGEPCEPQSHLQNSHLRRITKRGNPLYCLDKLLLPELCEILIYDPYMGGHTAAYITPFPNFSGNLVFLIWLLYAMR